ncbi:hypothetical protein OIV83_001128 [Microbotryomycetes sp. JL201]|nr:hypothetical protein OIV83_001128 [Microbotryomycetes sp. JL201]
MSVSSHRLSFSAGPSSPSPQVLTFAHGRQSRSNSIHTQVYNRPPPKHSSGFAKSPALIVLILVNVVCLGLWRSARSPSSQALEDAYEAGFRARQIADRNRSFHRPGNDSSFDEIVEGAGVSSRPRPLSSQGMAAHVGGSRHASIASAKAVAVDPATQTCEVCVRDPNDKMCKEYGLDNVRLSRAYQGSGTRVRQFIEKALNGEKVKIGVIGGSVSAGHGVRGDKWWERWFRTFNDAFPKSEIYNGALPAMDSDFYSFCFATAVPDDMDLYIVELDINNLNAPDTYKADDALFRALLDLPQQPAVVRTSFVATSFPDLVMGYASNLLLSTYFDVPVISIRNFLLPHFMAHPDQSPPFFDYFPDLSPDYRHMAQLGHDAMGDMFTLYMREQTCETKRRKVSPPKEASGVWPKSDILNTMPRLYLWEPFSKSKKAERVSPVCRFAGSSKKPLEPHQGDASQTTPDGWELVEWNGKSAWRSNKVGARISFKTTGTQVGMHIYKRSAEDQGMLECWTDGHESRRAVIDAHFEEKASRPVWHLVGWSLKPGEHTLTCEVSADTNTDGHEVRIISVASR